MSSRPRDSRAEELAGNRPYVLHDPALGSKRLRPEAEVDDLSEPELDLLDPHDATADEAYTGLQFAGATREAYRDGMDRFRDSLLNSGAKNSVGRIPDQTPRRSPSDEPHDEAWWRQVLADGADEDYAGLQIGGTTREAYQDAMRQIRHPLEPGPRSARKSAGRAPNKPRSSFYPGAEQRR